MRYAIIAVGVIALALSGTALAQPSGGIEIGVTPRDPTDPNPPSAPPSDPKPYDGGVIEVNPGDVETIWFHVVHDGGLWHLNNWEVEFDIIPSGPEPPSYGEVLDEWAQTSIEYPGCSWVPLVDVIVDGPPCTFIDITVTVDFGSPGGVPTNKTETIHKHIIPEPASMLLLGAGALGLLLRKRRS